MDGPENEVTEDLVTWDEVAYMCSLEVKSTDSLELLRKRKEQLRKLIAGHVGQFDE